MTCAHCGTPGAYADTGKIARVQCPACDKYTRTAYGERLARVGSFGDKLMGFGAVATLAGVGLVLLIIVLAVL